MSDNFTHLAPWIFSSSMRSDRFSVAMSRKRVNWSKIPFMHLAEADEDDWLAMEDGAPELRAAGVGAGIQRRQPG